PEEEIYFSYDDRDRIIDIQGSDYHYNYEYGLADTFTVEHLPIVKETNLLTNKWSEYISTYEGLPLEYFDSFYWRKVYEYDFNSSSGTPPSPKPKKVLYYRKAAADRYETTFTYGQANILGYKTQTYLGRQIVFEYNTNRLMKRKWYGQINYSGFPYVDMRFDRDNSGLITSITSDSNDKALIALTNNDLEIEQVQHTAPQVFDEGYTYDTRGNRLTSLTNSYTYNDLNQLTNNNTHTYSYDADGNLIEEKNITTTETKKFYYNAENRMIKYEHYPTEIEPVDIMAEYKYDIYGRRIQKNVNGVITNFHWEGDNLSFELNENHQPIRRYIYENGKDDVQGHVEYAEVDDPQYFSFERKGWYSYIKDQVGTITKVYKHETKQMVDTRTYDTFGNLINQTGSSNGNLGFQSKYFDQESGLNYYYHRYYYPQTGR
ncbi:MAG: hypothetical protein KAS65_03920, partial [Candidatus Aminicenantes bacterium]|nr:hypothetical protein [Candidatus Aminicenantes bacterium]